MPAKTKITENDWDLIIERTYQKQCVPFLGAAVNVSNESRGYQGLPIGSKVALRLVEKLLKRQVPVTQWEDLAEVTAKDQQLAWPNGEYKELTRIDLQNLARVALQIATSKDVPQLVDLIRNILPDAPAQVEPSPLLQTLATLPLRLIVTTNYDRLMERALDGKAPYVIVQPTKGFSAKEQKRQQKELAKHLTTHKDRLDGTIVYKIHGTFDEVLNPVTGLLKENSAIIITEEDYIEFLTVVGKENGSVPNLITQLMVDSTLLFLGYSLEDWDIRTLYKGLIERLDPNMKRKSFAIQRDPSDFWVEYWDKKGIAIYNVDLYEFSDQLRTRYQQYAAAHPR
jgi:hypothetical protein